MALIWTLHLERVRSLGRVGGPKIPGPEPHPARAIRHRNVWFSEVLPAFQLVLVREASFRDRPQSLRVAAGFPIILKPLLGAEL